MSVHQACLIADWEPTTLFVNGAKSRAYERERLDRRSVAIEPTPVRALNGPDGGLSSIAPGDGRRTAIDALYLAPRSVLAIPLAEELGVGIDAGPIRPFVRADTDVMTTLRGVYAAGDIARPPDSASWAVADGITAGIAAHRALMFGEIRGTAMRGSSVYGMRDAEGMSRC